MSAKVLQLRKVGAFDEFLSDLKQAYDEGKLTTIVCIAQVKLDDNEDNMVNELPGYWFGGDSCVGVLGLLEVMKRRVHDYMADMNEE